MKRVYALGMIGLAAVALLSLIELKSFSSKARLDLTRIETSPEIPGGPYPGSENQVLLEFTNQYPGSVVFGLVRTEVLTEKGWQVALKFAPPGRLFHPFPSGLEIDSKTVKLWAPAPPGKQPWRAVVRYRQVPRRAVEQRLDTYANKMGLCYPPFHDLTTRQINQ